MIERHDTVVIGGGQAGLSMSYCLGRRGREHVVLERGRVAERWHSERWDSLHFQFPNWAMRLPGYPYAGNDPNGFAHCRDVTRYIEDYAQRIDAPVRCGTAVTSLARASTSDRFIVETSTGALEAAHVVIATGPFQRPAIPAFAASLPRGLFQVHSNRYRNPGALPPGAVLLIGSGGSGCQIAEELCESGRTTYLAANRHRLVPRRYRGRDALDWMLALGRFDIEVGTLPDRKLPPTVLFTGVRGGHDIDLHRLAADGVVLLGRVRGCADGRLDLNRDLEANLAFADDSRVEFVRAIDAYVREHAIDAPDHDAHLDRSPGEPIEAIDTLKLAARGIRTIVWCTGYRFDFDWVHLPVLDARGAPVQRRGVTECPGAYFLGLHWMHKFKSGTLFGIDEDAEFIADHMASAA